MNKTRDKKEEEEVLAGSSLFICDATTSGDD